MQEEKIGKHDRKYCPYLHIKECPGCGRSCRCYMTKEEEYKKDRDRLRVKLTKRRLERESVLHLFTRK